MENNLIVSPSPHIHGGDSISKNMYGVLTVSYTHLDVYKRQSFYFLYFHY